MPVLVQDTMNKLFPKKLAVINFTFREQLADFFKIQLAIIRQRKRAAARKDNG